ncbi:MAG: tetratricopeptide repeat protein [Cyanobacteria bacterium FC1]|nr:tetratricopeptide repeat protein [Cyanobacteria bacterium FC1]
MRDRDGVEFKDQVLIPDFDLNSRGDLSKPEQIQLSIQQELTQIDKLSPWQIAHYIAIENWLTEYENKPESSNLEQVRSYLEVFHHLCEIEAWETAVKILFTDLSICSDRPLHKQLETWGYYQEQINCYEKILNKVNSEYNFILLQGLGYAYCYLGNPEISIKYYQNLLDIAYGRLNKTMQAQAHGGLGRVYYWCLGKYKIAVREYRKQLSIAREINDFEQEAQALDGLGSIYCEFFQFRKSIDYKKQALLIARRIKNLTMEIKILGFLVKKLEIAIKNGVLYTICLIPILL